MARLVGLPHIQPLPQRKLQPPHRVPLICACKAEAQSEAWMWPPVPQAGIPTSLTTSYPPSQFCWGREWEKQRGGEESTGESASLPLLQARQGGKATWKPGSGPEAAASVGLTHEPARQPGSAAG